PADADAFRDRITEMLLKAKEGGVDSDLFEEARRREIGRILAALDDPEWLVHLYVTHQFHEIDIRGRRELLDEVDPEEGRQFLETFVQEGTRAFSAVVPVEG